MKVSPNTERILYNVIWNRQWNPSTILFVLWCPWRVDYAESKKGMLQGSVFGRRVPFDHVLLINLCSKTLRLRASVSEMWWRTYVVCTTKVRNGVMQTIEILSVNIILFTYRRCSIWKPPTSIHFVYRLITSWRIFGKIHGISLQLLIVFMSPGESRTPRFTCAPRKENPMVSGKVSKGARLLDFHVQSIFCQRCHSRGDNKIL